MGRQFPFNQNLRIQNEMSTMHSKVCRPHRPIKLRLHLRFGRQKNLPNERLHRRKSNPRRINPTKNKIRPILQIIELSKRQATLRLPSRNNIKTAVDKRERRVGFRNEQNAQKENQIAKRVVSRLLELKEIKEPIDTSVKRKGRRRTVSRENKLHQQQKETHQKGGKRTQREGKAQRKDEETQPQLPKTTQTINKKNQLSSQKFTLQKVIPYFPPLLQ